VRRLFDRLPEGTIAIGAGLAVNGLAAYTFITISSRDLGAEVYTPVGLLWALSFLLGPGLFQPLEQETARIVASRSGQGAGPVFRAAARVGGLMALLVCGFALVAAPWIVDKPFDGEPMLLVGLLLVVLGLGSAHLVRGLLAGLGRFGGYSRYVMGEGIGRLVLVAVFAAILGSGMAVYGLAIGLAPFVGIGLAVVGQRGLLEPGDPVPISDLSRTLGSLLVASAATAFILNVSPLAVEFLASEHQSQEPGRFLNALLIARIPLFFFQAVQASLLPKLSGLAGGGDYDALWQVLRRLLVLVVALGAAAVVGCGLFGPAVVETAFGADFAVGRRDMVLLAVSSAILMVALSLAQALIATRSQGRMALAWVAGVVTFPVVAAFGGDLFLRVEIALVASVTVTAVVMGVLVERRLHGVGVATRLPG
jgi:O-antigen/teichoic acid export membrane protein